MPILLAINDVLGDTLLTPYSAGMMNVCVPLLQSEIAPTHSRGRLVGLHGFLLVTGYVSFQSSRIGS